MAPRHHIITSKFADLMKHPASDEPTIDIVSEKAMIHETLLLEAQNRGFDQELFFFTILFLLVWLWYLIFIFRLLDTHHVCNIFSINDLQLDIYIYINIRQCNTIVVIHNMSYVDTVTSWFDQYEEERL